MWIFVTLNYIFCDVFTLMYHEDLKQILSGTVDGIEMTQEFLLAFAVIMELPMAMILLSRIAGYRINRWSNIAVASLLTLVQTGSLFAGGNTLHYMFFSVVEITTTVFIVLAAWRWLEPAEASESKKRFDAS